MKIGYEYMMGYADALRDVERKIGNESSYWTEEQADVIKPLWIEIRHWSDAAGQAATSAKRSKDRDKRR